MSLRPDGSYRCDHCDRPLENGGVHECAIITDLGEDGSPRQFHLCRDWQNDAGEVVRGCVSRVLTRKALAANPPDRRTDHYDARGRRPRGSAQW